MENGREGVVDEALRARIQGVNVGSLKDLPALQSKIVRIFTSSTFTGKFNPLITSVIFNSLLTFPFLHPADVRSQNL